MAVSAPLLWPQELRMLSPTSSATDEVDEANIFAAELGALTDMKKGAYNALPSNKINKFYIPISKLPPLSGPGSIPRLDMGSRAPSCAPQWSVPRSHKVVQRWQSMPRLRSQLPAESLAIIQAAMNRGKPNSVPEYQTRLMKSGGQSSNRGSSRGDGPPSVRREDTDARLCQAFKESKDGSARGRPESPYIPCACCDHKVEKSWMQTRPQPTPTPPPLDSGRGKTPPGHGFAPATAKDRALAAGFEEPGSPEGQSRGKHTVSWEEPVPSESGSSEHWQA